MVCHPIKIWWNGPRGIQIAGVHSRRFGLPVPQAYTVGSWQRLAAARFDLIVIVEERRISWMRAFYSIPVFFPQNPKRIRVNPLHGPAFGGAACPPGLVPSVILTLHDVTCSF